MHKPLSGVREIKSLRVEGKDLTGYRERMARREDEERG